jgi:fructose-1-phosphate kinase PfkB-like protein
LDFRGEGLLSVLDLEPQFVKPNREELERTVGHPLESDEQLVTAMRSLNDRGARWVVITQGAGPVWASSSAECYRFHPPTADCVVNPIGSGDALAATLAWAEYQGRPAIEAVRLGIAAAQQNMRDLLPCRLNAATLEDEAKQVLVERVA